jgi:hypothetical protein
MRRTMEGLSAEAFPQELDDLIGYFTRRELCRQPPMSPPACSSSCGVYGYRAASSGLASIPPRDNPTTKGMIL